MSSKYLLIVDDDQTFLGSLKSTLTARGYSVVTSTDPRMAAQMFDLCPIGAVILDMYLGESNAISLLNELASYDDTLKIPKVILSASGSELKLGDFKQFGVKAIFDKRYYTIEELCQSI